ncbi:SDR family oxidoreductase, partial [Acinetobacter baumannii]
GRDSVASVVVDVTSEAAVAAAFDQALAAVGGIDIGVSNAGIASAAAVEDTTLDLWDRNMSILATGYFLVARAAFRL